MNYTRTDVPETSAPGQLAGIRVLDLSRVLAGPLAAQMLADLGAEVIKVERPGVGDESRQYGPPFLQDPEGEDRQQSAFYLSANRDKRSLTLDLSHAEGQSIARSLAAKADIVIENFRVGALARYGLDYATLSALNPGLIYCSITGYGQTGPYKDRPGYDAIFQAMSGLMSSIGHPDDAPGGGPMRTGPSIVDVITSLYADIAMLSALHGRAQRGGRGEYIDLALLDCGVAAMSHYAMSYLISGRVAPRRGNGGNGGVHSQVFTCSDGLLSLTAGNDAQFGRLCQVIGLPDLPDDSRFASGPARIPRYCRDLWSHRLPRDHGDRAPRHDGVAAAPVRVLGAGHDREFTLVEKRRHDPAFEEVAPGHRSHATSHVVRGSPNLAALLRAVDLAVPRAGTVPVDALQAVPHYVHIYERCCFYVRIVAVRRQIS